MAEHLNNLISGSLMIGFSVWIWIYTGTFPELQEGYPGPALFPRIIAIGLLFSGIIFVGSGLRRIAAIRQSLPLLRPAWPGLARLALGIGLIALYPLMQGWVGFIPTISILSFVVAIVLKARLIVAAITALLSTLALYGLFTSVLGVPL